MPRIVELIVRMDNRTAIRGMREVAAQADRTAAQTDRAFRRTTTAIRSVGVAAETAGRGMIAMSVPLLGIGYLSAKSAIKFQQSMEMIHTQAGMSQKNVDQLSGSVLKLAKSGQVSHGPDELARGLFHLASIGVPAAHAIDSLKIASQGAAIGNANLEDTATALGSAWLVNIKGGGDLRRTMGILNATVGQGNMRMGDLVTSLGVGVLPAAKRAGLGIEDVMGALAVFADEGYRGSSAMSQFATSFHFLTNPTAKATKDLAALHMGQFKLADDLKKPHGLVVAFKDLGSHLAKLPGGVNGDLAQKVMGDIFPGGRGRIMTVLMNQIDRYQTKMKKIHANIGAQTDAIRKTQETAAFKVKAAWASIQASMVQFGATLLPIINKILPQFLKVIQDLFKWFTNLSPGVKSFLVHMAIFLPLAGTALIIFGKTLRFFAMLRDAWIALKAMNMVGMFSALAGRVEGAGAAASAATGEFAGLGAAERGAAGAGGAGAAGAGAAGGLAAGAGALGTYLLYNQLSKHHKHQVQSGISRALGLHDFGRALNSAMSGHPGAALKHLASSMSFGLLGGASGGLVTSGGIRRYAMGGPVGMGTDTVPGWLTPGEGVLNRAAMANLGTRGLAHMNAGGVPGAGMSIHPGTTNIMLDSRVLARAITNYALRTAARGPSGLSGGALVTGAGLGTTAR